MVDDGSVGSTAMREQSLPSDDWFCANVPKFGAVASSTNQSFLCPAVVFGGI